jgi:hypothetical protein
MQRSRCRTRPPHMRLSAPVGGAEDHWCSAAGRATAGPRRRSSSRPPPLVEAGPSPTMKAQHSVRSVGAANRFRICLSRRAGVRRTIIVRSEPHEGVPLPGTLPGRAPASQTARPGGRFPDCRGVRPLRGLTARACGRFADCRGGRPLPGLPGRAAVSRTAGGRGGRPIRGRHRAVGKSKGTAWLPRQRSRSRLDLGKRFLGRSDGGRSRAVRGRSSGRCGGGGEGVPGSGTSAVERL